MGAKIAEIIQIIDGAIWGVPLMVAIMGTGLFLSCRLGFLQFRKLGRALKFAVKNEESDEGDVTSFGALCTALAATIGTGNIVGVATAIGLGGPGALFWMVAAACLGMATKYSEGVLALKYRVTMPDGHKLGGPFCYIEHGMGSRWKWLAIMFAIFGALAGALGIGTATQMNGIASAVQNFADPNMEHTVSIFGNDVSIATVIAAIVVTAIVIVVIIGGISRIAKISEKLVPFMAIIYVAVCLLILVFNYKAIPGAIGLGSAPIAAAAAKTKEPVRQGLVSMTGTFIDTVIICSMTGLTIMVTGAYKGSAEGAAMTATAFGEGLPWGNQVGAFLLMVCLALFAFTTILGWNYYGERCFEYLMKGNMKAVIGYRWLYVFAVFAGPFLTLNTVWAVADILNALMALPNLIALLALNGVIVAETRSYFKRAALGQVDGFETLNNK